MTKDVNNKKKIVPSVTRVLLQKNKETENGFICLQVILIEILMKLLTFCNFKLFFLDVTSNLPTYIPFTLLLYPIAI